MLPNKIELPSKYYHSHFRELTSVLFEHYQPFFEETHLEFLKSFEGLSEDGQCLFLRMMNRKGRFFFKEKFQYPEIESIENSLQELFEKGFVGQVEEKDWEELLSFFPKKILYEICLEKNLSVMKSCSRNQLEEVLVHENYQCGFLDSIVVQKKQEELMYLLFLFFGRIQENLALYTLRDLGIRKSSNDRKNFKVRFKTKEEALSQYFYSKLFYGLETELSIEEWPRPLNAESRNMREELLLMYAKEEEDPVRVMDILKHCQSHPGREKYIRLLYQAGQQEEAKAQLEKILENPYSDIEYLFAEDFFARKFGGRKISILTETLRNSRKIEIDESYFRHPEEGVKAVLKSEGIESWHLENYVWNCLFGLLFWEELFESEKSSLFNEFERLPQELLDRTFCQIHEKEIEEKFLLLQDKVQALELLLHKCEAKKDVPNGIFSWHESIPEILKTLLEHADPHALSLVLRHIMDDYHQRYSGFPDLMALQDKKIKFYEIKAPGDSLKQHQLVQMIALQKAGFDVEVLQVSYSYNPDQLYVVVDIETTGGHMPYHRITELGAVKMRNGEVIDKFQTLVNPERHISREIEQLTGISNEMVRTAPKFHEVADAFEEFTKDCIFVAHNVSFDYGFLQMEYGRLERKYVRPYICTKAGMKKHYPNLPSYGLKNLSEQFSIPLVNHHRALADAEAAAGLLNLINQKRADQKIDTPS